MTSQSIAELIKDFINLQNAGYTSVYIKQETSSGKVFVIPAGRNNEEKTTPTLISNILQLLSEILSEGHTRVTFKETWDETENKYFLMVYPVIEEVYESYKVNIDEISLN